MEENTDTDNFVGFYDFEIDKVKRNLEWMRARNNSKEATTIARKNFVKFFKQHDERRGTDLVETFPEFKDLWRKYGEE